MRCPLASLSPRDHLALDHDSPLLHECRVCRNLFLTPSPPSPPCYFSSCSYSKMEKVTAELFCFTYGAMVSQLLRQYKDAAEVTTTAVTMLAGAAMLPPSLFAPPPNCLILPLKCDWILKL